MPLYEPFVRAGIVIVKGQSSRKGFEASVSIYVAFWTHSSALAEHVRSPSRNHFSIANRSKTCPPTVITGSFMISEVSGHSKPPGMGATVGLTWTSPSRAT